MDQLRLQGMDGVDAVLALLRGVYAVDLLTDVAEILELDIEDLQGDRRQLLRAISNFINSDEFDNLGDQAVVRTNEIHDRLDAYFRARLPPPPPPPPGGVPGIDVPQGDGAADAGVLAGIGLPQQDQGGQDQLAVPPQLALGPVDQG